MKLIHLGDLHFGKLLHGLSLAESGDQRYWAEQCLAVVEREKPQAVLLAGDIYDRSQPSGEARALAGWFLTALCRLGPQVLMIAGNHDSAENVDYLRELLADQGLHVSGVLRRELTRVTLSDEAGPVDFWLLPYFFPARAGEALGTPVNGGYTEAARQILAAQPVDPARRNVLIAHQLVLSGPDEPERGGSETMVGGLGQIDCRVFDAFDYVALGHIHRPQAVGRPEMNYCGAPLCYHFDEAGKTDEGNARGIQIVTLGPKGQPPEIRRVPAKPLHPLRNITGTLAEVVERENACPGHGEYLHVHLLDDTLPERAQESLNDLFESHGSRLLLVTRKSFDGGPEAGAGPSADAESMPLRDLFEAYYQMQLSRLPEGAEAELIREAAALTEECLGDTEEADDRTVERLLRYALAQKEAEA